MKILQVIDQIGIEYGGSAMAARKLSRELAKRGHDVAVYASDAGTQFGIPDAPNVSIFKTVASYQDSIRVTPRMLFARFGGFDIIHCHNYYTFQNLVVALRVLGRPVILQPHGSLVLYDGIFGKLSWGHKLVDVPWRLAFVRRLSGVICVSPLEAEQARRLGMPEAKIKEVPNGIDLGEFGELPAAGSFKSRHGIPQDRKVILYLGRLHWIKRVPDLVIAFSLMKDKDAVLVIVGEDDGDLARIMDCIYYNAPRRVLVLPALYGKEKLEAYVDAGAYVLPSRYEIFGITVLEALACGAPVIVSKNCGISSMIDDKAGWVVDSNAELKKALDEAVADDGNGREYRQELVKPFGWGNVAEKMESAYLSLVEGK